MTLVLGMAKSNLDLKGAKGPKLELDFLRLAYAKQHLQGDGREVRAFLVVAARKIKDLTDQWAAKYKAMGDVEVVVLECSAEEEAELIAEKKRNTEAMVSGTLGRESNGGSDAAHGKELGERFLRQLVCSKFAGIREISDEKFFPFGIRWDFFGETVEI